VALSRAEFEQVLERALRDFEGRIDLAFRKSLERFIEVKLDKMLYGNSFELDGERVDPRRVVLNSDGTYKILSESELSLSLLDRAKSWPVYSVCPVHGKIRTGTTWSKTCPECKEESSLDRNAEKLRTEPAVCTQNPKTCTFPRPTCAYPDYAEKHPCVGCGYCVSRQTERGDGEGP
jgi:hypothetical protein